MTEEPLWIILPGLTMAPEEYRPLAELLPGEVRTLDSWRVSVTSPTRQIQREIGTLPRAATLVGHSIGALAALEWALTTPESVERLILLDPSSVDSSSSRLVRSPRGVRSLLRTATRMPPLAHWLGRASRRRFLAGYGIHTEYLDDATATARFGQPDTAVFFWDQLSGRQSARGRVRELLDHEGAADNISPVLVINSLSATAHGLASRRTLASRLNATTADIDAGHLFPATHPRETFDLL